jgi:phage gp46-like protein
VSDPPEGGLILVDEDTGDILVDEDTGDIIISETPGAPPIVAEGTLPTPAGGDIRILWDNSQGIGDWGLAEGDVLTGQDLETACLVSLFTDKAATPDFVPTDGTTDRRGWWADYYLDRPLGSNLWQLDRAKKTRATLGLAQRYAQDALQWLIDDGVVSHLIVNTSWQLPNRLGIAVALVRPNGAITRFMFNWAWQNLARLPSPIHFEKPFG